MQSIPKGSKYAMRCEQCKKMFYSKEMSYLLLDESLEKEAEDGIGIFYLGFKCDYGHIYKICSPNTQPDFKKAGVLTL